MRPRTFFAAVIALSTILAGCTAPPDDAPGATDTAEDPGAAADRPTSTPFTLTDCHVGRWFFFIETTHAKASLPEGFHPTDAAVAFRSLGAPIPPGTPATGRAVAAYDAWECTAASLGTGTFRSAGVYLLVDPPRIPEYDLLEPAGQDLYALLLGFEHPDWVRRFHAFAPPAFVPSIEVIVALDALDGGGSGAGRAEVKAGDATLMRSDYQTTGPSTGPPMIDTTFRAWHIAPNGTLAWDTAETTGAATGTVTACMHAEGSPYAEATKTQDCRSNAVGTLMSLSMDSVGGIHWFPGAGTTQTAHDEDRDAHDKNHACQSGLIRPHVLASGA